MLDYAFYTYIRKTMFLIGSSSDSDDKRLDNPGSAVVHFQYYANNNAIHIYFQ